VLPQQAHGGEFTNLIVQPSTDERELLYITEVKISNYNQG